MCTFFISFSTRIFLLFLLLCVIDPVGSPSTEKFSSKSAVQYSTHSTSSTHSILLVSVYKYTFSHSLTHSLGGKYSKPPCRFSHYFSSTSPASERGNLITVCRKFVVYNIAHFLHTYQLKSSVFHQAHMYACTKYVIRFQFFLIHMCLCRCFSDHCALYTHTVIDFKELHTVSADTNTCRNGKLYCLANFQNDKTGGKRTKL